MKTEQEITEYLKDIKKQVQTEIERKSHYGVTVGKTVIATLMWVLGQQTIDLNRLEEFYEH